MHEEDFKSECNHEFKVSHKKVAAVLGFRHFWLSVVEQRKGLWVELRSRTGYVVSLY